MTGAIAEELGEPVVVTLCGGPDLEDCFAAGTIIPKLLGALHANIDLFDERLHQRWGCR